MEDKFRVLRNAEKFVVNGDFARAVAEYQRILKTHGEDPLILNTLGDLLLRTNRREEAMDCFQRVAENFVQSGFLSKAIAILKKIEQLNPTGRETLGRLADLYTRRGLRSESLKYLRKLTELLDPLVDREALLSARRRVVELDPQDPGSLRAVGDSLSRIDPVEAAESYVSAAEFYFGRDAFVEARDCAQNALQLDPTNRQAGEWLTRASELIVEEPEPEVEEAAPETGQDVFPPEVPPADLQADVESQDTLGVFDVPPGQPVELGFEVMPETGNAFDNLAELVGTSQPDGPDDSLSAGEVSGEPEKQLQGFGEWDLESISGEGAEEQPKDWMVGDESALIADLPPGEEQPELEVPGREEPIGAFELAPELGGPPDQDEEIGFTPPKIQATGTEKGPLKEALQEVDFFMRLDLHEDATRLLQDLLRKYPDDPGVLLRAEEMRLLPLPEQDGEGFVLDSLESDGTSSAVEPSGTPVSVEADADSTLEEAFFQQSDEPGSISDRMGDLEARADAAQDDPTAQYELAIAYREMGLHPDAVVRFERAYQLFSDAAEPEKAFRCCSSLAAGCVELADYNRAVEWADIGLSLPQGALSERNALEYDRALSLEMLGEVEESLTGYRRILEADREFRDVQQRVSGLEPPAD